MLQDHPQWEPTRRFNSAGVRNEGIQRQNVDLPALIVVVGQSVSISARTLYPLRISRRVSTNTWNPYPGGVAARIALDLDPGDLVKHAVQRSDHCHRNPMGNFTHSYVTYRIINFVRRSDGWLALRDRSTKLWIVPRPGVGIQGHGSRPKPVVCQRTAPVTNASNSISTVKRTFKYIVVLITLGSTKRTLKWRPESVLNGYFHWDLPGRSDLPRVKPRQGLERRGGADALEAKFHPRQRLLQIRCNQSEYAVLGHPALQDPIGGSCSF